MSESWFAHPTLTGRHVRLEPLGEDHVDGLLDAVDDPRIFHWTSAAIADRDDAVAFVRTADEDPTRLAYAQIDITTERIVGSTSLYLIDPKNRSLAIGHTWLSRSAQGTLINPDAKLLLLRRAFEISARSASNGTPTSATPTPAAPSRNWGPSSRESCASIGVAATGPGATPHCSR